ncbi:MAG TPA: bifunctional diaminohydroxyphosphoribosylaminopyrimidine deaminase/5-amino-6-(5-phosphoribosylamino)uracil reductase RibD [Sphingomonas sp.]|nr:bifunctional diaminohydroxyphosphoribosylaminopyrimidine deaminase/5-amino-6-(5-phosphoribosylamino)uracil reductase RibD [Sphingomonas sp.]
MGAALALGARGRGRTAPNPNIGCVIVKDGRVVGRGWTQPGGRPHAEAMALAEAGEKSRGATLYVTLEPCAHQSPRGPACADLIAAAGVARVVAAAEDPDPRTAGGGFDRLRAAGIEVATGLREAEALRSYAGFVSRQRQGRPHVTLKLATSLDGRIALPDGSSRWITGEPARTHAHLERSRHEEILVGRGTWDADAPRLDVRLEGLEDRSPHIHVLSSSSEVNSVESIAALPGDYLLVEGGAETAAAFLGADLVDRLLLYRAPILIGAGKSAIGDLGLGDLAAAHGRWQMLDARQLGSDRLEVYERNR